MSSGGSVLPIAVATPQSVVYCTADDVSRLLGFGTGYFTNITQPNLTDVNYYILQAQDVIDEITGHAWRLRTSRVEYHEMARLGRRVSWFLWLGYPTFLNHRMVQPFNSFTLKLTSQLTSGSTYTSLSITPATYDVAIGAQVILNPTLYSSTQQIVTTTAPVAIGATSITVASFTANMTYPVNQQIMSFSAEVGDVFQVMENFNVWVDWTQPNRTIQWWADWNQGIIFVYFAYLGMRQFSCRFQYRYGDVDNTLNAVIPGDIKMSAQLYAARLLVIGAEKWNLLPQNANNIMEARGKVDQWLGQFDAIMQRHSEYSSPH